MVRQRSAKPLFVGSIPTAALFRINKLRAANRLPFVVWSANGLPKKHPRESVSSMGVHLEGRAVLLDGEDRRGVGEPEECAPAPLSASRAFSL